MSIPKLLTIGLVLLSAASCTDPSTPVYFDASSSELAGGGTCSGSYPVSCGTICCSADTECMDGGCCPSGQVPTGTQGSATVCCPVGYPFVCEGMCFPTAASCAGDASGAGS
jgi:hypothetical protein